MYICVSGLYAVADIVVNAIFQFFTFIEKEKHCILKKSTFSTHVIRYNFRSKVP